MRQSKESQNEDVVVAEPVAEKFYRVRFHAKSNPNDTENVEIAVNGEQRVISREAEVVLPERFIEAARHATYPTFSQQPGKPRKVVGKVQTFPFDILGEAEESEYRAMLKSGTKATQEHLEKFGVETFQE